VGQIGYTYDRGSYGGGPVQTTLPPWQWPDVRESARPRLSDSPLTAIDHLNRAWTEDMGFPFLDDGSMNGDLIGVAWRPISTDGKNQTRSSARQAYYDPVQHRPNLQLLVNSYVGKVHVRKSKAKGVEVFSRSDPSRKVLIPAKKEVILAAGGIHTPQILQLSGVGPRDLLERLDIPVVQDLPGVGANFMDHPTLRGASFQCKCLRTASALLTPGSQQRQPRQRCRPAQQRDLL
jgi:choline dehydrogenase-like flavoprotein